MSWGTSIAGCLLLWALSLSGCSSGAPPVPELPAASNQGQQAPAVARTEATEKHSIDLGTALRIAAGSHLDFLESQARRREAAGVAAAADGFLLPVLSVAGTWGRIDGQAIDSFGKLREADFGKVNVMGTVSLSTNVGESVYRDLAAHRLETAASKFAMAQLQRTLLEVARGYLLLVEADAAVRIHEQFVEESEGILRVVRAKETQGLGTSLDTERARAQAADARQRLILTRNERQHRSKALSTSLRLDAKVDLAPLDKDLAPALLVKTEESLDVWLQRGTSSRPERFAYQAKREASEREASAARWALYGPQLAAAYSAGALGRSIPTLDEREEWVVGLGWSFSLGGLGRIDAADARKEQADIQMARFQDRLESGIAGAFQELALSRERLTPADEQLAAGEKALRLARATYETGLLPETDLLLSQQSANQARLQRLGAVARFNLAQLELLTEAGVASIDVFAHGSGK